MQPDDQNNYWKKDSNESAPDHITEMYTPEPSTNEPNVIRNDDNSKESTIDNAPIHWSSSEYIDNEKNSTWFIGFSIVVLAFIAIDIFLLKSYTFSALVIVMAVAVIVFSRRPPRMVDYTLSGDQGLYVSERLYHFSEFKAFGLVRDHDQHSIVLIPTKRFAPSVSVYFPAEVGEGIVDILGARLPMETLKLDFVDIVIRKLRL